MGKTGRRDCQLPVTPREVLTFFPWVLKGDTFSGIYLYRGECVSTLAFLCLQKLYGFSSSREQQMIYVLDVSGLTIS